MDDADRHHHERIDPHSRARWLSDVVLGGQDGLVNVLGVILGVAAATGEVRVVLAAGTAAAFAESVSMAAVAYTSTVAQGDLFRSEHQREHRHITTVPEIERAEIRAIFAAKGFEGELLDRIVETITKDPEVWVRVMMHEEHGLVDVDRRKSLRSALVVGLAALVGSFLPLIPFLFASVHVGAWLAVAVGALVLFAFGAYKAKMTTGHPMKSGIELAMIGTVSALVGFFVGAAFAR